MDCLDDYARVDETLNKHISGYPFHSASLNIHKLRISRNTVAGELDSGCNYA